MKASATALYQPYAVLLYRIATFALQRTFRFTPLGLAFCFFRFRNTHLAEGTVMGGQHTHENVHSGRS